MLRSKLLPLLLTAMIAILPVGGIVSDLGSAAANDPIRAEATVEAAGTKVHVEAETTLPPAEEEEEGEDDPAPAAPGAPGAPEATRQGDAVALRWTAPSDDGGSPILRYTVHRAGPLGSTTLPTGPATQAVDATASPRALYRYAVSATNAYGEGPRSNETVLLPAMPPLAPEDLDASLDGQRVRLAWTHDEPETVDEYVVYSGEIERGRTSATRFEDRIAPGETRSYHVVAVSAAGASAPSDTVDVHMTAPLSAPRDLVATGRPGAVDLTWSAPLEKGEGALRYLVYRTVNGSWTKIADVNDTAYTDHVAQKRATFRYHVRAVAGSSESGPSNEAVATVPGIPPTPFGLRANGGIGVVNLSWDAVEGATSYQILRDGVRVANVTDTRHVDTGLAAGTTYRYQIVTNVDGDEWRSVEASATTWSPPSAPRDLQAEPGAGRVILAWHAPSSDGGSPITEYRVYRSQDSEPERLVGRTTNLSFVDAKLSPGIAYRYTVSAVSYTEGLRSTPATATPFGSPTAPRHPTTTRGAGSIGLSWSAPASTGGSAILGYRVYEATNANASVLLATVDAGTLSWRHAGLRDGEEHAYQVAAFTEHGEGERSDTVVGKSQSKPGAPRDVQAQVNLPSTATRVSWSPPEDNGGTRITSYRIYYATSGSSRWSMAQVDGSTYSWWDESCPMGGTCIYVVTAVNARGEGPGSDPATSFA